MDKNLNEFLAEGMKSYKKASEIMSAFFKETQSSLQTILKERKKWGRFVPDNASKVRSTRYWDDYPLINAYIDGSIDEKPARITIAVNWYQSESDYPFYSIFFNQPNELEKIFNDYEPTAPTELNREKKGLILRPDPENFNLEKDMNILIDEFLKALDGKG